MQGSSTCVEAGVVGVGEGDDEAALLVDQAVHGDPPLLELRGGEQGDELVQQIRRRLEEVRQRVVHRLLQRLRGVRRHAVPHLRSCVTLVTHLAVISSVYIYIHTEPAVVYCIKSSILQVLPEYIHV